MRKRASLATVLLAACASDPGTFKPARTAREYPQTEERARVADDEGTVSECGYLGTVEASGDDAQRDISRTAAAHGATHYVIKSVTEMDSRYETDTVRTLTGAHSSTREVQDAFVWAKVYHCGS